MKRRAVLIFALTFALLAAAAQSATKMARIGWLSSGGSERNAHFLATLRQGLRELGYVEGKDILIEARFAEGQYEKLPALTAELIRFKPDVLVAEGTPAARAAKSASNVIPIVTTIVSDPVGDGLVASLARPGGNVTGLTDFQAGLVAKRLELLREMIPAESRIAVLSNPTTATHVPQFDVLQAAAPSLGVTMLPFEARRAGDIERAFTAMRKERPGGLLVVGSPLFGIHSGKIMELAAKSRLPTVYPDRRWPDAGGLMSYGTNYDDLFRRAATYVDKILKGTKPADLPVEQPTKFELVINLKTAKALGLTIPPSLLLRADEVVQ